jgi:hypothetical protein
MPGFNIEDFFLDSLGEFYNDPKWTDGIYGGIKLISNTHVGSVGMSFLEKLCLYYEYDVDVPVNRGSWDMVINDVTFEVKTATEDTNGSFQFNHIRYHRPYQAVLCLGVAPNILFFNMWSKADIATGNAGRLVSMEKGANASYKLTKRADDLYNIEEFDSCMSEFLENF